MFHPVGSQPPSVYWRRRLLAAGIVAIVIVLLAITVSTLTSGGSTGTSAGPTGSSPVADRTSSSPAPRSSSTSRAPSTAGGTRSASGHVSTSSPSTASSGSSASGPVQQCQSSDLKIAAVVKQHTYQIGQDPMVGLQVTNVGPAPCTQDLADKQIVLKVYNGVSRVWGSQDCQVQPGRKVLTLAVGAPVLASVSWSGETSQPNCAGTRQHVGAGTYTLYASLSGHTGTAARFTIG